MPLAVAVATEICLL